MKKIPQAKVIEVFEIIELLNSGMADKNIAKHLGCHETVVSKLRRTMMAVKPTIKAPIVKAAKPETKVTKSKPPISDYSDYKAATSIEIGSRQLLVRQLETGQHWLDKERFVKTVNQLGLANRLPRELRI